MGGGPLMDQEMFIKSQFLKKHHNRDLISNVFQKVSFLAEIPSPTSTRVLRGIQIDLSTYFSPPGLDSFTALSDLAADFLSCEYQISQSLSFDLVETCIEMLLAYIPSEKKRLQMITTSSSYVIFW